MIHGKTVGSWTLDVSDPKPMWITITRPNARGEDSIRFADYELQDLIYALRCAEIEVCSQNNPGGNHAD